MAWRGVAEHVETTVQTLQVRVILRQQILRPFRNTELERLKRFPKTSAEFGIYRKLRSYALDAVRYLTEEEAEILRPSFVQTGSAEKQIYLDRIGSDFTDAEKARVGPRINKLIKEDLNMAAMEGFTAQQRTQIRQRAAWLADLFVKRRTRNGDLRCDDCLFDPYKKIKGTKVNPRSLVDVHHKRPLEEGIRITTLDDFALLCPTCHRFVHATLGLGSEP